jgi:hypothetical protein
MDRFGVPEIMENEAYGVTKHIYNDIQMVLKVPIINFMFRTLAFYERFFTIGWEQVRLNMLTTNVEEFAAELRYPEINVEIPGVNWSAYYDKKTIEFLRKTIFTFNYVNTKLLLIASAWAESLSSRPILGKEPVYGFIHAGVIPSLPKIHLVSVENAALPIQKLLLDIAKKHHAFDVASDFRALANFPRFLEIGWRSLSDYVGSDEYNLISAGLKSKSIQMAHQMPYPVTVNRGLLETCCSLQEIAGVMGVVSMFQNFLPGLIIDGEFFRRLIE